MSHIKKRVASLFLLLMALGFLAVSLLMKQWFLILCSKTRSIYDSYTCQSISLTQACLLSKSGSKIVCIESKNATTAWLISVKSLLWVSVGLLITTLLISVLMSVKRKLNMDTQVVLTLLAATSLAVALAVYTEHNPSTGRLSRMYGVSFITAWMAFACMLISALIAFLSRRDKGAEENDLILT